MYYNLTTLKHEMNQSCQVSKTHTKTTNHQHKKSCENQKNAAKLEILLFRIRK